jgi:hypothetical protein
MNSRLEVLTLAYQLPQVQENKEASANARLALILETLAVILDNSPERG